MLRDRVKETLERTEPGEREAKGELQTILARTRGEVRPWWRVPAFVALAGVAVAASVVVLIRPKPPAPMTAPQPEARLHLYIHVPGEPLDKALTLDLDLAKPKGK